MRKRIRERNGLNRALLRREIKRLESVDAQVVSIDRVNGPRGAQWIACIETSLGRCATAEASTSVSALRRARRTLGYRPRGRDLLVLEDENDCFEQGERPRAAKAVKAGPDRRGPLPDLSEGWAWS